MRWSQQACAFPNPPCPSCTYVGGVFLQTVFCTYHDLKSDGNDREQPCNISQLPQHPKMVNLCMFNLLTCALILSPLTVGTASSHRLCSLAQGLGVLRADLSTEILGKKALSASVFPMSFTTGVLGSFTQSPTGSCQQAEIQSPEVQGCESAWSRLSVFKTAPSHGCCSYSHTQPSRLWPVLPCLLATGPAKHLPLLSCWSLVSRNCYMHTLEMSWIDWETLSKKWSYCRKDLK